VTRKRRRREDGRTLGRQGRRKDLRGRLHAAKERLRSALSDSPPTDAASRRDAVIFDFFRTFASSEEKKKTEIMFQIHTDTGCIAKYYF